MFDFISKLFSSCAECVQSTAVEIIKVDLQIIENKISTLLAQHEQKIDPIQHQAVVKSMQIKLQGINGSEVPVSDLDNIINEHVESALLLFILGTNINANNNELIGEYSEANEIKHISGGLEIEHDSFAN